MIRVPLSGPLGGAAKAIAARLATLNHRVVAAAAALGVVLVAVVAIQVFGDPAAAGPRRVVSLTPSVADAADAPTISFSDALDAGPVLDLGAYPTVGEVGEIGADGELRVAVVEAPETSGRPPVTPLPRAPIAGLTESGPNGPLPIIGPNGRTPAQAYARPFTPAQGRPTIAIVIGGLGFNAAAAAQAIDELPPEITLSFVPYAQNLQGLIDRARARGHEVMLELPMEPFDPNADDTGPETLLATAQPAQNIERLERLLSRASGYFGVTNYQGARFATSSSASQPMVQALRRRGLVFISSGIGQRSAFSVEAQRANLPITAADRIIDARREAAAIDDQLLNLEALALQNQSAIGAGFAYPVTMEQVNNWARDLASRGYALAPASAVLNARATRR